MPSTTTRHHERLELRRRWEPALDVARKKGRITAPLRSSMEESGDFVDEADEVDKT
jgi:hypothetical protein